MKTIKSLLLCAFVTCLSPAGGSLAGNTPVNVDGTIINIPDIPGQCALFEDAHPVDAALLKVFRGVYEGVGELLQVAYECADIAHVRTGVKDIKVQYWSVVALGYVGEPLHKQRLSNVRLEDFIDAVVRELGDKEFDPNVVFSPERRKHVEQVVGDAIGKMAMVGEVHPLGVLARDTNVLYFGALSYIKLGEVEDWVLYVQGITLINGWPISAVQYASFQGEKVDYEETLKRARVKIESLISANGTGI